MPWRRESVGLVVAILVHAAAFVAIPSRASWTAGLAPVDPAYRNAIEVDVERSVAVESLPQTPETTYAPQSPGASELATATGARRAPRVPAEQPAPPSASSTGALDSDWSLDDRSGPSLSALALGLGGKNPYLGGVPGRPTDASEPLPQRRDNVAPGVDRSMRDAALERDLDLGLGSGGPLIAVAEDIMRSSDAPVDGVAIFEVTIDANGDVVSVRVGDVGDALPKWRQVAKGMLSALRSRPARLRHAGKGVVVTLEVRSRWVLPSGSRAGRPIKDPYVTSAGIMTAVGGSFDVSDIGARPSRDVHARVLGERGP
jgi:hypothetical protein